ncbi:questin oxidase family protein [Photobacterium sp. 53610]|uniref:questin oxidase family protein n=1 Tax=Photobacterium sp. 53610 TaxID=3102789 RepID=UPI002EDB0C93
MYHPIHPECLTLIQQGLQFDPLYGPELSNHLPMALIALTRCGASPLQLQRFYQHHTPNLQPVRQQGHIQETTPELGDRDSFPVFHQQFRQQLAAQGVTPTLQEWLPVLLPGLAASAFHALIRLSYALEADDADEIAMALAYWASEYQPLGALTLTDRYQAEEQLAQAYQRFHHVHIQPWIITERIREVVAHPDYRPLAAVPDTLNEADMARLTIGYYLASNDFTLLHGVTSFDALRQLLPYVPDRQLALAYYWQAYVAAFCSAQMLHPISSSPVTDIDPDWPSWFSAVTEMSDDHHIKLAYSCSRLYQVFPFEEYLTAIRMLLAHPESS